MFHEPITLQNHTLEEVISHLDDQTLNGRTLKLWLSELAALRLLQAEIDYARGKAHAFHEILKGQFGLRPDRSNF